MSTEPTPTLEQPVDPCHNITAREIDRDLINLHLPEVDLIATDEECAAMYRPGFYAQMFKELSEHPPHRWREHN